MGPERAPFPCGAGLPRGPSGPTGPQPSGARIGLFVLLYVVAVPLATAAGEAAAQSLWPLLARWLGVPPWSGTLPETVGGPVGGQPGLFALRGLTGLLAVALLTDLFQRGLWRGGRGLRHLGLAGPGAGRELLVGTLLGGGVMALVVGILCLAGWATWPAPAPPEAVPRGWGILLLAVGFGLFAAQEELIARGFLLQSLGARWPFPAAAAVQAAFFGLAHLANPHAGVASTAGIFCAGLFFAAAYARTGRLWLPTGLHIGWNLMEGPMLGLPLSGLRTARFLETHLTGPVLATGGSFGPEAGLVAALTLLLATWWLVGRGRRAR